MTIDPRVGFWLSIVLAVIGIAAGSNDQLSVIAGPDKAKMILAYCALLMGVGNAINAVLHAIPSQNGANAAGQFLLGPKVAIALLIGSLALLAGTPPARADVNLLQYQVKRAVLTAAPVVAIAALLGGCTWNASQVDSTTDKVVQAFQTACLALPGAHQNFVAIATAFNVKQSVIDAEANAYNKATAFCASGAVGNVASAVKSVNDSLSTISQASQQAAKLGS